LGLAAASFYLIVPEDVIHGTIVRVDALAACLSFLALTIGWRKPSSNAVLAAAAAVGVAAWFTKQTAVLGPAALFLWLLLHNRRRALVFGAMYVGLLAAAIGVAEMAAGGVFLKTVLGYSVAGFSWRKLAFVLYWHFLVHRPIHYLLLLSFLGGAWALVRGGWRATPWPVYFAVCLASLIWLGKAGSSSLYFLEFHLACAIGLAAVLPALRERSARLEAGALVVAAVVCLWSLPDLAIAPFKDRDPAAERVIVAAVRAARGPLLMENAGYAVLAGRDDLDLPNPFLAKTLIERGVIALQPYVDRTREKRYGLIVLDNPAAPPTGTTQDRFPRALLEEIDRSYRLAGAAGGSYFYLPKPADPM
jgi:hypothetical protein